MIYFTSDLHLGHKSAIEFSHRPFADVDEMNTALIANINDTVGIKDELWILGDFAYKVGREEVRNYRKQIKCKHVHLINGNHDRDYSRDDIFSSVQDYKELKTEYGKFILFHYPIMEWNAAHHGTVHLHGHIHSTGEYNANNHNRKYADRFEWGHGSCDPDMTLRIYDVGVDANQYRPISLESIAAYLGLERISSKGEG